MRVSSIPTPGFCPKSSPPAAKSENIYFCVSSSSLRDPDICFVRSGLSSSRLLSGKESAEKMSIDGHEKYIVINFYSLAMFPLFRRYMDKRAIIKPGPERELLSESLNKDLSTRYDNNESITVMAIFLVQRYLYAKMG